MIYSENYSNKLHSAILSLAKLLGAQALPLVRPCYMWWWLHCGVGGGDVVNDSGLWYQLVINTDLHFQPQKENKSFW